MIAHLLAGIALVTPFYLIVSHPWMDGGYRYYDWRGRIRNR